MALVNSGSFQEVCVLGLDWLDLAAFPLPGPRGPFAYVGLGPGQEFLPYFLALMGFIGAALLAIIQWPLLALRRLLARARGARNKPSNTAPTQGSSPNTFSEDTPDKL